MQHVIEMTTIDRLKPFPGNPKTLSEVDKKKLIAQIRKHGLLKALSVWKKGTEEKPKYIVLDGNQRLEAIKAIFEEDGNSLLEIAVEPIECTDEDDAREKCLALVCQFGRVSKSKYKRITEKAGYKTLEEAQAVFSFVEMDGEEEEEKAPQKGAKDDTEPSPDDWEKISHVQCPNCNVQFPQKKHRCKPSEIDKSKIWKE